jgi:ATP-dependent DNA helicase RecQ
LTLVSFCLCGEAPSSNDARDRAETFGTLDRARKLSMELLPARNSDKFRILKEVFGFDCFRPGQERAVDALVGGRNVLMVMPTGSGKSLCFQVPALVKPGLAIVVSPLVALMQDQVAALRLAGVAADSINSARDRNDNVAAWLRASRGETRLLYMAPERLMTERMLAALGKLDLSLIAIDEAHCISQWGPSFRPEYEALSRLKDIFAGVPIAALTATADETTRRDIAAKLFAGGAEMIVQGFDRPNIRMSVAPRRGGQRQLLEFLDGHREECGIVYCLSRKKTEEIAKFLAGEGIRALPYHAGMTKEAREENQNRFMTESAIVIVATIAFGMGIDKSDVRYVFHVDLPSSPEAYYQEIGRAGRDGAPAEAHMLYGLDDIRMRRMFIDSEGAGEDRRRREHQRLNALVGYCEASGCRRQILLSYFGEKSEPCGNCDTCLKPVAVVDGTREARLVMQAVAATGQRFGSGHLIDILRGSASEKVVQRGHSKLNVFGSGEAWKSEEWRALIRQLVAGSYLALDIAGMGGLRLTENGEKLARGEGTFQYRPAQSERPAKRSRREPMAAELSQGDYDLLTALKALRLRLAKERGVPAYVIFPDRTLIDMAQRCPRNENEFVELNGVGKAKLAAFGRIFLAAIDEHLRSGSTRRTG